MPQTRRSTALDDGVPQQITNGTMRMEVDDYRIWQAESADYIGRTGIAKRDLIGMACAEWARKRRDERGRDGEKRAMA